MQRNNAPSLASSSGALSMQSLQRNYIEQLKSMFPEIVQLKDALVASQVDVNAVTRLSEIVHTLSGLSTTVGFPAISETGRKLDVVLASQDKKSKNQELRKCLEDFEHACYLAIMSEPPPDKKNIVEAGNVPEDDGKVVCVLAKESRLLYDLNKQLKHFGYDIILTAEVGEFKSLVAASNPHVTIVYSDLSEDDIEQLSEALQGEKKRKLPPQLIVISSQDNFEARLAAVRLGAQGFFHESTDVIRIIDKIEQLGARFNARPTYHILLIDDDEIQVRFYTHVLQAAGMMTTVVEQPRDALEVVANQSIDLVLMDFIMPKCNGQELATIIRQHDKYVSLPIIFLSARDDLEQLLTNTGLGIDDFLVKPVTSDQLVAAVSSRAERSAELQVLMARDGFTGLFNHAHFMDMLEVELGQVKRFKISTAYVSIDIDSFKSINDNFGHASGDMVIKALSRLLQQRLRRSDIIGRCGGDEFGITMPDCTIENALLIMESIRQQFADMSFKSDKGEIKVTFSAGVAALNHFDKVDDLTKATDSALYEAKNQGRNRIVVWVP